MALAHEWAPREKVLKSYELLARYVMPRFQDSLVGIEASNRWAQAHSQQVHAVGTAALERAHRSYEERG